MDTSPPYRTDLQHGVSVLALRAWTCTDFPGRPFGFHTPVQGVYLTLAPYRILGSRFPVRLSRTCVCACCDHLRCTKSATYAGVQSSAHLERRGSGLAIHHEIATSPCVKQFCSCEQRTDQHSEIARTNIVVCRNTPRALFVLLSATIPFQPTR